ncbi:MAG: hypothetical protein GC138_08225 [Gammaproteobacteria bacterium]|nr:hypothetical protein [Gammaproteobacteria bacterium]
MDDPVVVHRVRGREHGLLLIEVVITLFTIMIALLALGRIQAEIVNGAAAVRHRDRALDIALARLEEMRFISLSDSGRSASAASGAERVGPPGSGAARERVGLERIYDVRWRQYALGPWRDNLRVEVRWREADAKELSVGVETRLCRIPRYVPLEPGKPASLGRLYRASAGG